MNKTTLFLSSLLLCAFYLSAQTAKQGFDNKAEDNWAYTSNIPFYSQSNNSDIWGNQSNPNGRIPGPFSGSDFLAGRDLDNPYSEQFLQTDSPEHILTFETINIGGLPAELSFNRRHLARIGDCLLKNKVLSFSRVLANNLELFMKRFETPRPTLRILNFLVFDHIGGLNTLLHTLFNKGTVNLRQACFCRNL